MTFLNIIIRIRCVRFRRAVRFIRLSIYNIAIGFLLLVNTDKSNLFLLIINFRYRLSDSLSLLYLSLFISVFLEELLDKQKFRVIASYITSVVYIAVIFNRSIRYRWVRVVRAVIITITVRWIRSECSICTLCFSFLFKL